MGTCNKKKFINKLFILLFTVFSIDVACADINFKDLGKKKASYLDFFLLKFENRLLSRSQVLAGQAFATRVQYSNVGTQVDFDDKENKIFIKIYAIMDKNRYSKKKYEQKLRDCNQVRNLIFYRKHGYTFFRQKRDPLLSTEIMEEVFKEVFFDNISFDEKEIEFLLDNIFINVTVFHPVNKMELSCSGKANDYELK